MERATSKVPSRKATLKASHTCRAAKRVHSKCVPLQAGAPYSRHCKCKHCALYCRHCTCVPLRVCRAMGPQGDPQGAAEGVCGSKRVLLLQVCVAQTVCCCCGRVWLKPCAAVAGVCGSKLVLLLQACVAQTVCCRRRSKRLLRWALEPPCRSKRVSLSHSHFSIASFSHIPRPPCHSSLHATPRWHPAPPSMPSLSRLPLITPPLAALLHLARTRGQTRGSLASLERLSCVREHRRSSVLAGPAALGSPHLSLIVLSTLKCRGGREGMQGAREAVKRRVERGGGGP